jgi:hypothetical protein
VSALIPIVIGFVALIAIAVLRRTRVQGAWTRSGRGGLIAARPDATPPALRLLPLPGDVGLVAARELRTRVRGRVFRTGTLLVLVIVAAAIVIPTLLSSKASIQRVGVAGQLSAPITAAVIADGTAADVQGVGLAVRAVGGDHRRVHGRSRRGRHRRLPHVHPADRPPGPAARTAGNTAHALSRGSFPQRLWTWVCATPAQAVAFAGDNRG